MQSMTFKQVMDRDVDETFLNVAEFADLHNIDGNNVPALMTATTLVESLSRLYEHGRLTKAGIAARVKKGTITEDDYKTITGEDYKDA